MFKPKVNKILVAIFFIGLIIRIGYVLGLPGEIRFDEIDYDNLAWNIASGAGYVNTENIPDGYQAARPPGYPLLVSGIYKVFGHNIAAVRFVQAILSAVMILLIYLVAKESFDKKVAYLAASISIFYPFFIYYAGVLQSELLCGVFLLLAVLYANRTLKNPDKKNVIITGISIALVALTRPVFLLYGSFIFLGLLASPEYRLSQKFKIWFSITAIMLLAVSPWIIRNYLLLEAFVPGTSWGGEALYVSNHPNADGSPGLNLYDQEVVDIRKSRTGELERDRLFYQKAQAFIINDPVHYWWLVKQRFLKIWNVFPRVDRKKQILSLFSFGALLPFFLIGFIKGIRQGKAIMPALTIFYVSIVFPILFYGSTRLRFPIESFIIIFAAFGIISAWPRFGFKGDPAMAGLYQGQGVDTLFFHYRWFIFPHKEVASYVPKEGLIYDLGSGHGIFSNYLMMESPARKIIGIEFEKSRLDCALRTTKDNKNPHFMLGDIGKAEFEEADCFILLDVLHHCPGYEFQERLIRRCYQNLKSNGRLIIIEVNNRPWIKHALCWLLDNSLNMFRGIYYRNQAQMRKLLEDTGFKVKTKPMDKGAPYTSMLYIAEKAK